MINLRKSAVKILSASVTAIVLSACTAGEAPLELSENFEPTPPEPEIDAATIDPCGSQFEFQRELNGVPDSTRVMNSTADGKSLIQQLYWYEGTRTIVYFSYAEGETWCNVWNENGVNWDF